MDSIAGRTLLGRYFLRDLVGSGGMADVYLAWDKTRSVKMAIKVLRRDLASNSNFFRLFTKEAEILRTLDHPNIVRLYNFDKEGDLAFIVMDWVDGSNLRQAIQKFKLNLPIADISRVLESVCAALYYAHGMGIYHCDIKPANIMLHVDGRVLLTDFGVAQLVEETGGGGTPPYMAPEQFTGGTIDGRTDVYALGISLFEIFSGGNTPFRGISESSEGNTTKEKIAWEHLYLPPPKISQFNPKITPAMEKVIVTAIGKDPQQRYSSVNALREAFEKARVTMPEAVSSSSLGIKENLTSLANSTVSPAGEMADRKKIKTAKTEWVSSFFTQLKPQKHQGMNSQQEGIRQSDPDPRRVIKKKAPFLVSRSGQLVGQQFLIPMGEVTIGRGSHSQIKITESTVSRRHASLIHTKHGVYVRDDGSTLGTLVNGVRISGPVLLRDGDVIQLGHLQVFEYHVK